MRFGLKEHTIEQICKVFSDYPEVEKAMLYGSRAKGNYKNGSDIDLIFEGEGLTLSILHKSTTTSTTYSYPIPLIFPSSKTLKTWT